MGRNEGGVTASIRFDIRTPVADDGLVSNVTACLARGLPELARLPPSGQALVVIANGPSAWGAEFDGKPTLAVNGALRLFTDRNAAPDYWCACDPQAHLADFLKNPPKSTTYLVASKCHPSVFDALKDRNVIVWHLDDFATWDLVEDREPISSSVSVTICSFEVMERLGFRSFETWGWDASLGLNGEDHAVPQPHNGCNIEIDVGGRTFQTTTSWALEAQDGWNKLQDWPITIHGNGMIGAIFDYMRSA